MSKPTEAQIGLLHHKLVWTVPQDELRPAIKWLEENGNKWEVSQEISRIKKLQDSWNLTKDEAFNSPIWDKYKSKMEKK